MKVFLQMNNPIAVLENTIVPRNLTPEFVREFIGEVQDAMFKIPDRFEGDSELCPLKHSFADGIYVREIFIPKGVLVVGKIHKHEHPNFLMKGDVSVLTEQNGVERLKGPLSLISAPGTKRLVYAHEDAVWITAHLTKERDLEKIEDHVIAKSYKEYLDFDKQLQIDALLKIEKKIGGV